MRLLAIAAALSALLAAPAPMPARPSTPSRRAARLVCGVNTGLAGFSAADSQGNWTGLDVDICRAHRRRHRWATRNKVKWVPLTAQQRFTALQSGEVDMLSRNTTWTLTRDASLGLNFTGVTYYDGQGFMVPKKLKIKSAKQLKGATVCVQSGTTTEKNLTDFSRANKLRPEAGRVREARGRQRRLLRRPLRRPTPPTPRAWPRCATRKRKNPTTT